MDGRGYYTKSGLEWYYYLLDRRGNSHCSSSSSRAHTLGNSSISLFSSVYTPEEVMQWVSNREYGKVVRVIHRMGTTFLSLLQFHLLYFPFLMRSSSSSSSSSVVHYDQSFYNVFLLKNGKLYPVGGPSILVALLDLVYPRRHDNGHSRFFSRFKVVTFHFRTGVHTGTCTHVSYNTASRSILTRCST